MYLYGRDVESWPVSSKGSNNEIITLKPIQGSIIVRVIVARIDLVGQKGVHKFRSHVYE